MSDTEQTIKILAIESSCDETAAAVVVNGRDMRSNVISSQIALHTLYGGVVPEIASRKHIEKINQVIAQALSDADMTLQDMDAIGVTYGPGLVGALMGGVAEAKAISYAANIPLVGVHHIEGHISANYIENPDLKPPFLCLVVSGGHTHLVKVTDCMKSSDGPGMMRQEKHLIKWHAQSGWDIREDQKLKKFPMKEIRRQFPFRGQRLQMGYMISVSVD